ncbi:MAG: DUF3488 domain-containing transglutaminase family protein [Bdellovibrionales bacterium]|nr:DUF3488 domain-containing transglutaminase family protein [Bdellovibrionales bacterium]
MRAEDNRRFVYFLVGLNILPHWVELPDWVIGFGLTFVLWKYASEHFNIPVPGKYSVHVLGFLSALGVYNEYGTVLGDEASASVLVLTVSLKLFEVKKYRDIMVVTILCYFLLMSKLISSQSLAMTIFMIVDLVLITSLMALHHSPRDGGRWTALTGRSLRLALLSFPIVLALFFIFPRFSTGIFNPTQKTEGRVGFSDELNPGSIAKLLKSNKLVFRAKILNREKVPVLSRYWRGAVLEDGRGLVWKRGQKGRPQRPNVNMVEKNLVVQEIYLEPTSSRFLFGLDWINYVEFPDDLRKVQVGEFKGKAFESRVPVRQKDYYLVYSSLFPQKTKWQNRKEYQANLEVDLEDSPETMAWVEGRRDEVEDVSDAIRLISEMYVADKFLYTLEPPTMSNLDEFLFSARRGFCEHYAAATASLLRSFGFPARVVVGFQGGEPSLLGDFLQVRSQDAHAWIEYWNPRLSTWKRFDPTAIVSPTRVRDGSDQFLDEYQEVQRNTTWDLIGRSLAKRFYAIQMFIDQVDANWSMFLLKYDYSYQKEWLRKLGLKRVTRWMMLALSAVALSIFVLLIYLFLNRKRVPKDPLAKIYQRVNSQLGKLGVERRRGEGPLDFAKRVEAEGIEPREQVADFFASYIELKYGPQGESTQAQLKELSKSIEGLKLKPGKDNAASAEPKSGPDMSDAS